MGAQGNKSVIKQMGHFWNHLTEPNPSVTEPGTRQQSQILAALLLIVMTTLTVLVVTFIPGLTSVTNPALWFLGDILMIGLCFLAYQLSRQGRNGVASSITLALAIPGIFIPALMIGGDSGYTSMFYLVAPTIFASVFLSTRAAIGVTTVQLAVLMVLGSSFPNLTLLDIISGPVIFNVFMASLVILVTYYSKRVVQQRQKELAASEERYRSISELISDYAYSMRVEVDGSLRYEWITDEPFKRLSGFSIEELDINRNRVLGQQLFHPDDVEAVRLELARTLQGQETHAEHRIITRSGEVRWLHMFRRPYWDEKEQRVTRLFGVAQDITARKQAEIALRDNEERYRLITEATSDMVSLYDSAGQILYMSPSVQRTLGYSLEEMQLEPTDDRVHPEDLEMAQAGRQRALEGTPVKGVEYRLRSKSGEYIWIETYSNPIIGEDGKVRQVVVSSRNVTTRKQAEIALKASEERYRIITDLISDYAYYYRMNPDGTRAQEWVTESVLRVTGYSPQELIDGAQQTMFHPDDFRRAAEERKRILAGENISGEYRMIRKDGELRWLNIHRRPVWDESNSFIKGYYGVAQDITSRKQAELALKASEERYRLISELISDYAYSLKVEPDGTLQHDWITEASFLRATGYLHHEIHEGGQVGLSLYHPDETESLRTELEACLHNKVSQGEHRIVTKSGETRWIQLSRRPYLDETEQRVTRIYGVAQDITARKLAEIALKKSEERYRIISELISDYAYYFRVDPDGTRVREWVTDSVVHVTGYTPEELPAGGEAKMFHTEELQKAVGDRQRILQGENVSNEYRIVKKDGEHRWLNIRRRPVWDEEHTRVVGYYGVAQDITARKQAELQKVRMTLEHEQRIMVNQFMHALSHDFRTMLATIETSRYLIEKLLSEDARDKVQKKLDTIHQAVTHIASQLDNLYLVSSLAEPHPVSCDLNQLIDGVVKDQGFTARQKQISLYFEPDTELPIMQVDEAKFVQALHHLVINALTYTASDGTVIVRTKRMHSDVIVQVNDTGKGIHPDALPYVFEPFFRGDEARTVNMGGVGLGLTIVKMTVEAHGGSVTVESEDGVGTAFTISLPIPEYATQLAV